MNGKKREFSLDDAVALLGDPRKLMEEDERFDKDMRYFHQNYAELVKQYPDEWVAVYEEAVRASGPSVDALLENLKEKGLSSRHVFIDLLETQPVTLILHFR